MKKTVLSVLSACLVMGAASGVSATANQTIGLMMR